MKRNILWFSFCFVISLIAAPVLKSLAASDLSSSSESPEERISAPDLKALEIEGQELYRQHRYQDARNVFDRVLSVDPTQERVCRLREQCERQISKQLLKTEKAGQKSGADQPVAPVAGSPKTRGRMSEDGKKPAGKNLVIKEEKRARSREQEKGLSRVQQLEIRCMEKAVLREKKIQDRALRKMAAVEAARVRKEERLQARAASKQKKQARGEQEKPSSRELRVQARQDAQARHEQARLQKRALLEAERTAREQERRKWRKIRSVYVSAKRSFSLKEYEAAIQSFQIVIESERGGPERYAPLSRRYLSRAHRYLKDSGVIKGGPR